MLFESRGGVELQMLPSQPPDVSAAAAAAAKRKFNEESQILGNTIKKARTDVRSTYHFAYPFVVLIAYCLQAPTIDLRTKREWPFTRTNQFPSLTLVFF